MNTKKIIGILIFILWVVCKGNILFAQDTLITRHPIEVKATNRDGKVLKFKQIIKAANAEELPEAAKHFRRAQVFDIVGKTLGFPGAFIVGYSLGSALSSPNGLNHQTLVIGLGLIGIEYTIYATLRDPQMKKGIRKYNEAVYKKRQSIEE